MKKILNRNYLLIGVFVLAILAGCSQGDSGGEAETAENFYEDETMEFVVPFGTGGGTDVFARYMAPYFNEHLAGQPEIQVVNVPGGGSINGANEFVEIREHNGLNTLVTSASTHVPYFLDDPNVQYDLSEMKPIAGLPTGGVVYTSPSTGIESAEDIQNPDEDLVYAGISATGLDLVTLLAYEVLDMDVQAVLGYDGRGPSRVAFENGEANIDYQTTTAYLSNVEPLVEEGSAQPLFAFGQLDENGDVVRDPAFPNLPSLKEFYVEAYGEEPSGEAWEAYKSSLGFSFTVQKVLWTHSDAPEASVEALTNAAEEIKQDEEFNNEGEEVLGGYELYTGENLDSLVQNMLDTDEETIDWMKDFLQDNYDIKRND